MATVYQGILEAHEGAEPRVLTEDVQRVLQEIIKPGTEDGAAVATIAEKSGYSTRTVYRVLNPDQTKVTLKLEVADRLCLAAGSHLSACRLVWPDGSVTEYTV